MVGRLLDPLVAYAMVVYPFSLYRTNTSVTNTYADPS